MFKLKSSYRIIEPIGEGLNASVYKVSKTQPDLKTQHIFALKVLKRSSDLRIFKLEFENLLKAHGKHLVRYCGWEHYKSMPALLLEYIDGVTLHELFESHELSEQEVNWVHQETLAGLAELAESGLSHGDLSLKNIMIQKDGHLKLIDFGLSHWSTKNIELTPEFAAPELLNSRDAKPSQFTDTISAQKIIRKISTSFDPSAVLSQKNSLICPPQSLREKVSALKTPATETKRICLKAISKPLNPGTDVFAWFLTSLLFLTPASASNNLQKKAMYQIRSKEWAKVTNHMGESCFTPCSLKLKQNAVESIEWQSQNKSGKINVYTSSDQVVSIDF